MTPPWGLHNTIEVIALLAIIAAEFWWLWNRPVT